MSEIKLRYYADAYDQEDHRMILDSFRKIHNRHGIPVEIERVRERHGPVDFHPGKSERNKIQDVYDRDFHHNRTLSQSVGRPPAKAFKTNSGNITITGRIGIIDDGLVWATRFVSSDDREDPEQYSVDFLQEVLKEGSDAITEKYEGVSKRGSRNTERQLVKRFARSGTIPGEPKREVAVGGSVLPNDLDPKSRNLVESITTRNIDLVVRGSDTHWVIEAKREWKASTFDTALGQVLVSNILYRNDNNLDEQQTQMALLFGNSPGALGSGVTGFLTNHVLSMGIEVFIETDDGFRRMVDQFS